MATDITEQRKLVKALKHLRTEHLGLIKKVAKSRAKFEKRSRELQAIEAEISELVHRTYEPETRMLWAAAMSEDDPQPATPVMSAHSNGNGSGQSL